MDRVKKLLTQEKPLTWVFYGDSITHGAVHTLGERDYTELFDERLRAEMGRPMDIIVNSAISGDTSRGLLESFEWRVARFKPDVVFVMIGMNDCSDENDISLAEFTENIATLADKIRDVGALPLFQTTCPILPGQAPERTPHFPGFMDAVRTTASAKELPFIDHTAIWHEQEDKHFFWMNNAFHPNAYGHRAFARTIFQALDIWDQASLTCQLFIP